MFENYHLSNNASIVSDSVPGEESLKLLAVQEECESNNRSYPRSIPLAFDSAKGRYCKMSMGINILILALVAGFLTLATTMNTY